MPKRPPRVVRELPVPRDLRGAGPTRALAGHGRRALARRRPRAARAAADRLRRSRRHRSAVRDREGRVGRVRVDRRVRRLVRSLARRGRARARAARLGVRLRLLGDPRRRQGAQREAVRGCRWLDLVLPQQGEPRQGLGPLARVDHPPAQGEAARIDVDAVRVPYNGHTTKYPARVQAVSSQYGRGEGRRDKWEPNPLGAKPRDVIEIPVICNGMAEKTPHATQKPEALIEKLIARVEQAGSARRRSVRRLRHHRGRRGAARAPLARGRRGRAVRRAHPRAAAR